MTKSFDYLTIQLFLYLTYNLSAFEMILFFQIAVVCKQLGKAGMILYKPEDKYWQMNMQTFLSWLLEGCL